jgi:hypothetical protein
MAKAQFYRNQKVWVESVGAWATVERINPVWAKGFDEPVRITYEVGLGREFLAHELRAENRGEGAEDVEQWRVLRARNKWQQPEDCGHHPFPGTFPVVVTEKADWGGWRVPGAEYDRDPHKIEYQARLIASAPQLLAVGRGLIEMVEEAPTDAPPELVRLAHLAALVERYLKEIPEPAQPRADEDAPPLARAG